MAIIKKKKVDAVTHIPPRKKILTREELEQERIDMQSQLDRLDFEIAKKKKTEKLKEGESIGDKIQKFGQELDKSLSIIDDSAIKDPVGKKKEKNKSSDDKDPFDPFATKPLF